MAGKAKTQLIVIDTLMEQAIRAAIDKLPFYVMLIDEDHHIVLTNKVIEKALGKKLSEIRNGYCPTIVHGTKGPFPGCPLEEAAAKHAGVTRELHDAKLNRWFMSAVYPTNIRTPSGKDVYYHTTTDITEHKQASEDLAASEKRYREIVENVNDGLCIINLKGKIIDINENTCRMVGRTRQQLVGDSIVSISRMDNPRQVFSVLNSMKQAETTSFESTLLRHDGGTLPIEVSAKIVSTEADGIAQAFIRDISERKQADEALIQAEAKFRIFADTTYDWEYWLDCNHNQIIYMSPSCERITGHTREEFIADPTLINRIVYPEDRAIYQAHMDKCKRGKNLVEQFDFRVLRPDGDLRWVAHACQEVFDAAGRSLGRRASNRDITARRKLEDEAILREAQLRQIIDLVPHMIFVRDWDGRFILANEATAAAYDMTTDELQGKKVADVHPDHEEAKRVAAEDQAVMTEGQTKAIPEAVFTDVFGKQRIMQKTKVPFTYIGEEGRQTYAVLGVSVDVTKLKEAETESAKNLERLTEAFHGMIAALAATVETRDKYTAAHQYQVRKLATAIANDLDMSDQEIDSLGMAATVHDIGKIYVPSEILSKPGRLSEVEFELIKTHVEAGYNILKDIRFRDPIANMVRQHHERLDGSGYPQGLKAANILLEAKILAVADVVDAMTSHRPYRPGLGIDAALDEIQTHKGTLYDPDVVEVCVRLFREQHFDLSA